MATYRNGHKRAVEGCIIKAKITERVVYTLVPKEERYEIVDTELAGFILGVQPSGSSDTTRDGDYHCLAYRKPLSQADKEIVAFRSGK